MAKRLKTLRLILGDQLNYQHSWFKEEQEEITYVFLEMQQETNYTKHHIQKLVGFFSAMRNFASHLEDQGMRVIYYKIGDANNKQELPENLQDLIKEHGFEKFEYQLPDEYRLDKQLEDFCGKLSVTSEVYDTEHFFTSRKELSEFYEGKKQLTMEYFYRYMRKKHSILMLNNNKPEGGKWNFDKSNRKKWKGDPEIPHERGFRKDVSSLLKEIEKAKIQYLGNIDAKKFNWPTNRQDSLSVLNYFCRNLLIHFGDFQDALHTQEAYLFHSRLSFALNTKMISPKEVIDSVTGHWYKNKETIDISQVEGFVRQILGWREYMRGIYWKEMPGYQTCNKLNNKNKLPKFYWDANTNMNCLSHSIQQSLDNAYAHHIQRLMITGNYALLTQTNPSEVDDWYLGIYIDAIEWVEITNTRGMSQFADGGLVATKPYVSSGSYINKMSNYCKSCKYNVKEKTSDNACPFNSLYWNFLDDKREYFKDNQRMNMMMSLLDKKAPNELKALKLRAKNIIENPNEF